MRFFEWNIFIWIILFVFLNIFNDKKKLNKLIFINMWLLILISIAQISVEGYRWQIIPLYIIIVGLAFFKFSNPLNKSVLITAKIVALLLIIINIVSILLLPLPVLPNPTGDFSVGTTEFYFIDDSRNEIYGPDLNAMRKLMIQIWYPVDKGYVDEHAPWMPKMPYFVDEIGERFGVPGFMLEHLIYVESNSFADAPISEKEKSYPVLLFSHGWAGFKEQNVFQVEELASHGYVVIAVNHTFGAMMSVFPDGTSFARDKSALPEDVSDEEYYIASNKLVKQWAEDLEFVLKEINIENNNPDNQFYQKLELEKVGVMGHSTGGGASTEFCFQNPSCGALLGMDPWLEPVTREKLINGHEEPMLLMFSEAWASIPEDEGNKPSVDLFVSNSNAWASEMVISGTMHFDFSITPVISPLTELLGFKGSLDGDRILEIINVYSLAFFGEYLGFQDSLLLDGNNSEFPEVIFSIK